HSKLAPSHALDFSAEVNCCQQLCRNTFRLRRRLFLAHRALLPCLRSERCFRRDCVKTVGHDHAVPPSSDRRVTTPFSGSLPCTGCAEWPRCQGPYGREAVGLPMTDWCL